MSDTDQPGSGIDGTADNAINSALDAIASHIPGGSALEGNIKGTVDTEANSFIENEEKNLGGLFGQK